MTEEKKDTKPAEDVEKISESEKELRKRVTTFEGEEAEAFVKNKFGKTPEEIINEAGRGQAPIHPEEAKNIFLNNLQSLVNQSAKRLAMSPSDIIGCLEIAKMEIYNVNKKMEEEYRKKEEAKAHKDEVNEREEGEEKVEG